MANEFIIKKGLVVKGASGGTVVNVLGSQGQLLSVTDNLSGSIFAVSDISGVPIFDVNSSGLVNADGPFSQTGGGSTTLSGTLNVAGVSTLANVGYLGDGLGSVQYTLQSANNGYGTIDFGDVADSNIGRLSYNHNDNSFLIRTNNSTALTLDSGQNATFAGNIAMVQTSGNNTLTIDSSGGGNPVVYFKDPTRTWGQFVSGGDLYLKNETTNVVTLLLSGSNATFAGQGFSSATSSGDGSSTLTTKGYVDGLITGATIYRGTWDPDITANSGNGTPDLSTVTQTSGYYYICSDIGTAHPNGTTGSPAVPCEPDSWAVGDWVIWNDDIPDCAGTGTGAWQKIDNTSVLSGIGTGQTVALWEGAGSVTDSETLGNAPITVSGNDTTFAGNITAYTGTGTGALKIGRTSTQEIQLYITDTVNSIIARQDSDGDQTHDFILNRIFDGTGANNFKIQKGGTDQFTLDTSANATFAGAGAFAGTLSAPFVTASNPNGAANGSPQEVARFVNVSSGATSAYMYIGASSGTDWRLGKNINGTTSNSNFGITKHSGTVLAMEIDGSLNTTFSGSGTFGGSGNFGGSVDIGSGGDLILTASSGSTDTGDIVFYHTGAEAHRLWSGTNTLNYRTDGNTTYYMLHSGNYTDYNAYTTLSAATRSAGDNTANVATTEFVTAAVAAGVGNYLPLTGGTLSGPGNLTIEGTLTGTTASFNSGATNVVASFTSTDGIAGIKLQDSGGNVELSASGNTFQVQPAGGVAVLSVTSTTSTFTGDIMPSAENLHDIGSASVRWEDIWADQVYGRSVYVDEYIYHLGDLNNNIRFQASRMTLQSKASGSAKVDLHDNGNLYLNSGGGTTLTLDTSQNATFAGTISVQGSGASYLTGNVGIGTTVPGNKLQVNAASSIADTLILKLDGGAIGFSGNNDANIKHGLVFDLCSYSGTSGVVQRQAAKIEVQKVGSWNESAGGSGTKADIVFSTNNGTIATPAMVEKMRITSTGNVGIGTSTPLAKLDIQGTQGQLFSVTDDLSGSIFAVADISGVPIFDVNSSGIIKFNSYDSSNQIGTPTYILGTDASGTVVKTLSGGGQGGSPWLLNASNKIYNTNNGSVGINTNNPSGEGNLSLGAKGVNEGGHLILNAGTAGTEASHIDNASNYFRIMGGTDAASGAVDFSINHTNQKAYFPGYVGFGITGPSYPVHAQSSNSSWMGYFYNTSTTGVGVHVETNASGTEPALRVSSIFDGGNNAGLQVLSNGSTGMGTGTPTANARLTIMGNQTFGLPGNGSNSKGRFISIEGNTDGAGEGSGRIFFSEHNSTTGAMDNFGMSLGYRGGSSSIVGASGNTWTGLAAVGNGQWGMWGHNNNATGTLVMSGDRAATYVLIPGQLGVGVTSFTPGIKLEVGGNLAADGLSLFTGTTRYLSVSAYNTAPFINTGATGGRVTFGAPTSYTTNVTVMGEMKSNTIVLNSGTNNGFITSLTNLVLSTNTGSQIVPAITITNGSGNITINGTATATNFILSSDKTLKNNIKEIDGKHVKINWKNFELKSEPGIKRAGVIAQELEKTNPEFVRTDNEGLKSVAYIDLLITKIAELEARLEKAGI